MMRASPASRTAAAVAAAFVLLLLFRPAVPAGTLPPLTYTGCMEQLQQRTFVSGEELLQLFSLIYFKNPTGAFIIHKPVLDSLSKVLRTYFPLPELDSVIYAGSRLTLVFKRAQKVCIPGLYRQAYMYFSERLVLKIDDESAEHTMIKFNILNGNVAITTTWLLKIFAPYALDARATSLFYRIDETRGQSVLGMRQDVFAPFDSLNIMVKDDEIRVNVRHPEMRDRTDLWFRRDALHYFGFTVKLPEFNYIKCSGYDREYKPRAYDYFKRIIADVFAAPQSAFADGVSKHMVLTYYLEEQRGQFWQEFGFGTN